MKKNYTQILTITAMALLAAGTTVYASELDTRIESSAKESYVFKTYLKDDSIKVESKDGVVALLGNVNQESHKSLAEYNSAIKGSSTSSLRLMTAWWCKVYPLPNDTNWTSLNCWLFIHSSTRSVPL